MKLGWWARGRAGRGGEALEKIAASGAASHLCMSPLCASELLHAFAHLMPRPRAVMIGGRVLSSLRPNLSRHAPCALFFQIDTTFNGSLSLPSLTEVTGYFRVRA